MLFPKKFTNLLNLDLPIVQGPFGGGMSSVELVTAVSNAGGLGSYGCQPFNADQIVDIAADIRKKTDKPFNLNLWVNDRDDRLENYSDKDYQKLLEIFKPYFDELGLPMPPKPADLGPSFENQVEAIFKVRPAVFSFVFGIPPEDILQRCRRERILTVGAATTVDEAIALQHAGVDAVVATGFEAGGHRVSFLEAPEDSLTGTMSLIPQVADSVSIPVIAPGGIADKRGMNAAFALGADAVQIGTAFLATKQSNATDEHREKLFSNQSRYTTLTKVFSGRLARGIRNRLTEELKHHQDLMSPYPMHGKFMAHLKNSIELRSMWAGQSAPLIRHQDATLLIESLFT